jgi:AAA domain/Relaxase/Mobilisation nuclease domain
MTGAAAIAVVSNCPAPGNGGSGRGLAKYILGYALKDKGATIEQKREAQENYLRMMDAASLRDDMGVGVVIKTTGIRPSAVYCRNVSSLETAALEIDMIAARNTRTVCAVRHDVVSWNVRESQFLTDEQAIEFVRRMYDNRGYGKHAQVMTVHRDTMMDAAGNPMRDAEGKLTGDLHVHIATASIDARTLKPIHRAYDHSLLHLVARQVEVEMGLEHDRGLYVFDEQKQAIRKATPEERLSWEQERKGNRLERLSRVNEMATYQDRIDRTIRDIDAYRENCKHSKEQPLTAELYLIAARVGIELQPGPSGTILAAAEGEQTVPLGELRMRGQFPTAEAAQAGLAAHLKNDPGRLARDLIAAGKAAFTREDIDGYLVDRLDDPELQRTVGDHVVDHDREIVGLSLDIEFPLFTTAKQQKAEQRLAELAMDLARIPNPYYSLEACDRAIAMTEKQKGFRLSDEQRAASHTAYKHLFAVVQGSAGSGKTSTVAAVGRNLAEITGAPIEGFSTAASASEKLAKSAGFKAENTARAATIAQRDGTEMTQGGFALYDEVSAASVDRSVALFESALRTKTCVPSIGDQTQLKSPSAGDVMALLADVAKREDRYAEIHAVQRQKKGSAVGWMLDAVPVGTKAILDGDRNATRAYFAQLWDHGHVVHIEDDRERVIAKAHHIAEAIKADKRIIATDQSREFATYTNRAVREDLGHAGGDKLAMKNGIRDFVAGDRVVFEKNDTDLDVKNGYCGTIKAATKAKITVALDGGRDVSFNPRSYKALDWGWVVTTFKSQGDDAELAAPSIGRSDTASSAHVAITRAIEDLKVFTPLDREEFIDHLTSAQALRLPPDAVLFGRIVDRFGGKDSPWARAMQRAQQHAEDPLRRDYDAFCTLRQGRYDAVKADVQANYRARIETAVSGGEKRQARAARDQSLRTAAEDFGPLTFVEWGAANRQRVEQHEVTRERVADLGRHRQAQEQKIAPRRSVESPQPRRRGISDDDLAAAIERQRARQAAEEERAQKIEQQQQKRGISRGGRGM